MIRLLLALALQSWSQRSAVVVAPAETLSVRDMGTGMPVLAIPGLFGAAEGFRRVADGLALHGYRVIIVEPLGIGSSGRPRDADYSMTAQAARVAAVLDSFAPGPVVVLAHSVGAAIAYRLALTRPEAVRAVVSLEGGPVESVATPGLRRALSLAPLLRLLGAGAMRGRLAGQLRGASGDPSWVTDSAITVYTAGLARDLGATLRTLRRMADAKEPWTLDGALERLHVPVYLVLGNAPHAGGPSAAEVARFEEALPLFTIERLDGVGHYAFEEAPDLVIAAVLRADGWSRAVTSATSGVADSAGVLATRQSP